jgi:hypothetical protein
MNDAVVLPLRERGMRWVWVAGAAAIHAAAFFLFRVTGEVDLPAFAERTQVRALVPSLERDGRAATVLPVIELFDSSLLALPSGPGFSGKLWGRAVPAVRQVTAWESGPAYLESVAPPRLPALVEPMPLEQVARAMVGPLTEAESDGEPAAPVAAVGERASRSVWRISGELANRGLVRAPTLPVMVSPLALRPTRLRVAAAADGTVRFVALDRGCGNDEVDARAMRWAREFRFAPADDGGEPLQWGVVRFLWATEPPPNGAAGR